MAVAMERIAAANELHAKACVDCYTSAAMMHAKSVDSSNSNIRYNELAMLRMQAVDAKAKTDGKATKKKGKKGKRKKVKK
jgi:hypothetical protein